MKNILVFDELTKTLYDGRELNPSKNGNATQYTIPAYLSEYELSTIHVALTSRIAELNKLDYHYSPLMMEAISREKKNLIELHSKICKLF